jgi:hypothetical protein
MSRDVNVREQMFSMISTWQQSGLSQKAFCQQNNISYNVFHYWYKCFRDAQLPRRAEGFIALDVQRGSSVITSCAAIEVLLTDGWRVMFHQPVSADYLKAIIG